MSNDCEDCRWFYNNMCNTPNNCCDYEPRDYWKPITVIRDGEAHKAYLDINKQIIITSYMTVGFVEKMGWEIKENEE